MTEDSPWWTDIALPALMRHARQTYGSAMRGALEAAGHDDMPRNGLYVIGAMARGEASLGDIIRSLGMSKQAAGQLVDTLVLRGYLEREVDPDDRRRLTVKLTDYGTAAAAAQRAAGERLDAELIARIGAEKVLHAREVMAVLIAMGEEKAGDARIGTG